MQVIFKNQSNSRVTQVDSMEGTGQVAVMAAAAVNVYTPLVLIRY